jgi:phosphodiesterase/alkaline phosphatase D-like protein
VLYQEKAGWQRGWFAQHQRLIEALAAQTKRAPLIVQGDFHATAAGKIVRSGELVLAQPVVVVMSGALGTGDMAFPSAVRSVESKPSQLVGMDEALKPIEKNGFTVIDVTPDKLTFTIFMWRPPQPVTEIDTMQPALVYDVPRKA